MAVNQNIWDKERNDRVFEGRNRQYGAYRIRRSYPANVLTGFVVAVLLLLLVFYMQDIVEWLKGQRLSETEIMVPVNTLPPPPNVIAPMNYSPPAPQHDVRLLPQVVKDSLPPKPQPQEKPPQTPSEDTTQTATTQGSGSKGADSAKGNDNGGIYRVVDVRPEFPGGIQALHRYIQQNLKYPEIDQRLNHQGRVIVRAIVDTDGSLTDVEISNGLTPTMNAEAARIVRSMPSWKPAMVKGHPVKVYILIPITFMLTR